MNQAVRRLGIFSGLLILFSFLVMLFFALRSPGSGGNFFAGLGKGKIGIIEIQGAITDSGPLVERLHKFRLDDSIKGVILRVDSPGGAVAPVQEIYEEIIRLREKKPVVASLGSVSASGGFYVAVAADRVFANPGTLTGSIGVIMETVNVEGLLHWARIETKTIKSGKFKDIGSPLRKMTPEEEAYLQKLANGINRQFIKAVSQSRKLPLAKVTALADGRVFSGDEAKSLGLVDELGSFQRAVEYLAGKLGISGEPVLVYPSSRFPRWRDLLENQNSSSSRLRLNFDSGW
jgi:protease-4